MISSSLYQLLLFSRFHIFMIGGSSSLVFSYMLTGEIRWNLMFFVLFDWFIVNISNNACDYKEDKINKISYSKLSKKYSKQIIIFTIIITLLSFIIHIWYLHNLLIIRLFGWLFSIIYNFNIISNIKRLKEITWLKNLSSCFGFVITLFLYPIFSYPLDNNVDIYYIISLLCFFIPFEISFEVIYDIRDYNGDKALGIKTFPVKYGKAWAKRLVIILDIFSIFSILISLSLEIIIWKQGVIVCGVFIHLIIFYYLNRTLYKPSDVIFLTWSFVLCQILYILWILCNLPTSLDFILGDITPIKIIDISMICICILTGIWSRDFFSIKSFIFGYIFIGISSCICENTVIIYYDFYHYNIPIWTFIVGVMPLEVTLIWPQVIYTTYRLMRINFNLSSWKLWLGGSIDVLGLALFVEICCVQREFWSWTKSNIAGVPFIGIIGWSLFSFCTFYALDKLEQGNIYPMLLLPLYSLIFVHIGILIFWFLGFNYISEYDIPLEYIAILLLILFPFMIYFIYQKSKYINLTVIQEFPRLCAAFVLIYTLLKGNPPLELLIIIIVIAVPFFGSLSLGWPKFLEEERKNDIKELIQYNKLQ